MGGELENLMPVPLLFGLGSQALKKPKSPALPPPVPMPDPEDRLAKLEARRMTTAQMASSGRQSTVLSSPSERLTSNLGG